MYSFENISEELSLWYTYIMWSYLAKHPKETKDDAIERFDLVCWSEWNPQGDCFLCEDACKKKKNRKAYKNEICSECLLLDFWVGNGYGHYETPGDGFCERENTAYLNWKYAGRDKHKRSINAQLIADAALAKLKQMKGR